MLKFGFVTRLSAAFALMLAIAFAFAQPAQADPCGSAPETTEITMLADWLIWAQQGPMLAAEQNGYFKDEGLKVNVVAPMNPADNIKLTATKKVELSMVTMIELLRAVETGIPVTSVAAMIREDISGLVFLPESGIKTPADLKGKVLGINYRDDQLAQIDLILAAGGLTKDDVKIVEPGYGGLALLLAGKLDAFWTGPKFAEDPRIGEAVASEGKGPIAWLFASDYGRPDMYFYVLVANPDWAKNNPATICRFLRASAKGLDEMYRDPDPILAEISAQTDLYSPELHRAFWEGSKPLWRTPDGSYWTQEEKIFADLQAWLLEEELMTVDAEISAYYTNEYLPESSM